MNDRKTSYRSPSGSHWNSDNITQLLSNIRSGSPEHGTGDPVADQGIPKGDAKCDGWVLNDGICQADDFETLSGDVSDAAVLRALTVDDGTEGRNELGT